MPVPYSSLSIEVAISSMKLGGGDLLLMFGNFSFRLEPRLKALAIDLHRDVSAERGDRATRTGASERVDAHRA